MTGRLSGPVSVFGVSFSRTLPRSGTLSLFRDDFPLLGYFSFQERCPSDFRSLRLRRCGLRRPGSRFSDACPPPFCGCGACALWACPSRFGAFRLCRRGPFASPLCPAGVRSAAPCAACFGAACLEDSCFRGDFVSVCMPGVRRPESGSRTSPVSFWMSFSSGRSSSEQNAIAVPSCPARPVRPMRCT